MPNGKWGDPFFPKSGWVCLEVVDNETVDQICAMCEVQPIRYVHVMEHGVVGQLETGCICAGHLEGNPDAAYAREAWAKKKAKFAQRSGWCDDATGSYIKVGGLCYGISAYGPSWRVSVASMTKKVYGHRRYPTAYAAKLGAFDAWMAQTKKSPRPKAGGFY